MRASGFEVGIGAGRFSSYATVDGDEHRWAVDVEGRLMMSPTQGIEIGFSHVPGTTGSSGGRPRLNSLRVMLVASAPLEPSSPVRLSGGLGLAALMLEAPRIECGDFPVCGEWAPQSGTKMAPVGLAGITALASRHLRVFVDLRIFRPWGDEWSAAGDPKWMTQLGGGVRIGFGAA